MATNKTEPADNNDRVNADRAEPASVQAEEARLLAQLQDGPKVAVALQIIQEGLAHATGVLPTIFIKELQARLNKQGLSVEAYFPHWVAHLLRGSQHSRIVMAWTEFPQDQQATCALYLLMERGRSLPLLWQTLKLSTSANARAELEHSLLRRLRQQLPDGLAVTLIADRPEGIGALLDVLAQDLGFDYCLRMRGNRLIADAKGECRKAKDWIGPDGRARSLRQVQVTDKKTLYAIATVVCMKAKGQRDGWCLLASDPEALLKTMQPYFDKPLGIEESLSPIRNTRWGNDMTRLKLKDPGVRDRLLLMSTLAIALLTELGRAGEALGYDRRLVANTRKQRSLSLFNQGHLLIDRLSHMKEPDLLRLLQGFAEAINAEPALALICTPPAE